MSLLAGISDLSKLGVPWHPRLRQACIVLHSSYLVRSLIIFFTEKEYFSYSNDLVLHYIFYCYDRLVREKRQLLEVILNSGW